LGFGKLAGAMQVMSQSKDASGKVGSEDNKMNWQEVERLIGEGYISKRKHSSESLWILNYTARAQYEEVWTPETKACRGLVVNENGDIVARPFEKFFNYDQVTDQIPNEHFDVYEKMDGSLGVMYFVKGKPYIATRGSFDSPQAVEANKMLHNYECSFDPALTYLFEIIYPENRIVIDYKSNRELVHLATIETATGRELDVTTPMPRPKVYDGLDVDAILSLNWPDQEGFVLRYESGFRVKVKFNEYKRLHKVLTGIGERAIWEAMQTEMFDKLLERVPDEFYRWATNVRNTISISKQTIRELCYRDYQPQATRKESAELFKTKKYPAVLFALLDGKDIEPILWKLAKPETTSVFKCDSDSVQS
jgi:RNA ligase